MQDFDAARAKRQRDFRIGGEDFTMRTVRPEVLIALRELDVKPPADLVRARRAILTATKEHGPTSPEVQLAAMDADPLEDAYEEMQSGKTLPEIDKVIVDLLDPTDGSPDRWMALRARETDPLTMGDVQAVMRWMIGEQSKALEAVTGRPTGLPSPSTDGPERTGLSSTGGSSSPGAKVALAR